MNGTGQSALYPIVLLLILAVVAGIATFRFWSLAPRVGRDRPAPEDGREAGFEPFRIADTGGKRVVWYGASILHYWPLPDFGPAVSVEKVSIYGCPEKVAALESALFSKNPDVAVLKLCSAYFSYRYMQKFMGRLSIEGHQGVIRELVDRCRKAGVSPVLVTVLPVTRSLSAPLWRNNNGNILKFNGWVRRLAAEEEIPLLDLAPVVSLPDGSLDPACARPDGLHISEEGYARLNRFLLGG